MYQPRPGRSFENVLDSLNQVFEMQIADFH